MHILITGASGFIGSHLVSALSKEGYQLTLVVRDVEQAQQRWPQLKIIAADFSCDHDIDSWVKRLHGIDIVINAVGIINESTHQSFKALHTDAPCALFKACTLAGVKKVIQVSALGADETAFTKYHLSKRAADECLMQQDLNWSILMPSIVYGRGAKSMALFKALAALPLIPVMDQGQQQLQPIHVDDLVRVVLRLIQSQGRRSVRIELVGPEPISLRELYLQLRRWLGLGVGRFISMPYRLMLLLASLGGWLGNTPLTRQSVQMLSHGSVADVKPIIYQFGFEPISLQAALDTSPATAEDRCYAGLYFLRPLLRISIALLWMFTGYVSAFVYPQQQSQLLLDAVGIDGLPAPLILYAAAAMDFVLGVALLFNYRLFWAGLMQIAVMSIYTVIISFSLAEFWWHPFGPVSKNIPLLIATLIMLVLERR